MKILHVSFESPEASRYIGGRGVYLDNLLPLQAKEHEVTLLTLGEVADEVPYKGFTLFTPKEAHVKGPEQVHGAYYYTNQLCARAALERFSADDFDVIHCHDGDANICAQILRSAWKLPLVSTIHLSFMSCFLEGLTDKEDIEKWIINGEWELFHSSDAVIACSKYYQDLVQVLYQRQAELIPNGIATHFDEAGCDLPMTPKVFFAGRFCPQKGMQTLLDVVEALPDITFVLAGRFVTNSDEEKARLRDYHRLQKLKETHKIIELGHITPHARIGHYAKQCDVWVAPSWHAPFELVGLEAMACGVPFIGTRTGAFLEYCTGDNSILVEPRSPDELAWTITNLLDNKAKQASMVAAGGRTVEQYSWAKCSQKTIDTYRKVLHEREGGNTKAMRAGVGVDPGSGAAQEIACAG